MASDGLPPHAVLFDNQRSRPTVLEVLNRVRCRSSWIAQRGNERVARDWHLVDPLEDLGRSHAEDLIDRWCDIGDVHELVALGTSL